MKREIWIHAGAFGEFKALLPVIDRLHEKYPAVSFWITTNMPELLGFDLTKIRDYLSNTCLILKELNPQELENRFSTRPLIWISHSHVAEADMLRLCARYQVPVVYLFEHDDGIFPPRTPIRKTLKSVIGVITQAHKRKELEHLGVPSSQIKHLKSLKWISHDANLVSS